MNDLSQFLNQGPLSEWEAVIRITLAAILGGAIGLEREWRGHPAGLRTNMLVAIGSCLFTLLSIAGFPLRGAAQDTARIAAQIVTGVGFLGAGVVLQTRRGTWGLTTAATIWMVAALGMAVGVGAYLIAIYTTTLTGVILILLLPLSERIEQRARDRTPGDSIEPALANESEEE
ncbi:MAG: MgtC/SapB family protein [Chloroflexota bacterium]|nr:MgtC/SapB family protein [Chloroflexota bacterium]